MTHLRQQFPHHGDCALYHFLYYIILRQLL